MLKALIFDVDGTLADTERDGHRVAFNQAFEENILNWHWSIELYAKLLAVTGGKERIRYYIDNYLTMDERQDLGDKDSTAFIAHLHQCKTQCYSKLLGSGKIPLRPGVKRLLTEAKEQGVRLAIATTTTPANVSALLEHTLGKAAIEWFDIIGAGDVVAEKKPAADIYQYVLDVMQWQAKTCIAFEDSYNGIQSSLGAGLKTIITTNAYTQDHDFNGAALVLDHLGELNQPFTVMAGKVESAVCCVDVPLLRQLVG